ncbi:MAG: response regulator [Chitinophagaceae bacterium]|nr:MAG: response regulator [Chitinophagaceae bacterium]
MRVLIIEDDPLKLNRLETFTKEYSQSLILDTKMSYQSGLLALLRNQYDIVLLDMQLPNYDIRSGEDGYKPRPMAGRDILREIKRKRIKSKVIIMTQYESFGENGKFESLMEWDAKFKAEFTNSYLQTIQYKPGSNAWKDQLQKHLANFI